MKNKVSFQWNQDENTFNDEYPTFLEPLGVTKDDVNEVFNFISEDFLKLDFKKMLYKRILRFLTLFASGILTIITAVIIWFLILFKTSLYVFLGLFLFFICGEIIVFIVGVVILNLLIDKLVQRQFQNIESSLNEQINSKHKGKGVIFNLNFEYDFTNVYPKLEVEVYNINDPWKKYPVIHLE